MKINIKVHPGSSRQEIKKLDTNDYEIWLKEKPIDSKANIALIKILKKYFKCEDVCIKSGIKSKKKVMDIKD